MTRILIPATDIEADVNAEQVTAYLLRMGWRIARATGADRAFYMKRRDAYAFALDGEVQRQTIEQIARAEQRHPTAVLADIVGPAAGSVGADCGSFFARECPARMLAIVTMGYADVAKVCAREAQRKESE